MKKYLNIVALFVCLMSGSVHAERAKLYAWDDMSCGAWAASAEHKNQRIAYTAWIMGFVSGHNWMTPGNQAKTGGSLSPETIALYLDKYCRENPLQDFINGTFELVKELRGDKN
jgi:hypothetical protein